MTSEVFNPPIRLTTGEVSAVMCDMAILRPMPGGGYIGFRTAGDAIGHPTSKPVRVPA